MLDCVGQRVSLARVFLVCAYLSLARARVRARTMQHHAPYMHFAPGTETERERGGREREGKGESVRGREGERGREGKAEREGEREKDTHHAPRTTRACTNEREGGREGEGEGGGREREREKERERARTRARLRDTHHASCTTHASYIAHHPDSLVFCGTQWTLPATTLPDPTMRHPT